MGGWIFRVMCVFFDVFEKVKKCIFALNFLKTGPTDLKICAKKTCNRSGSSPKILSKSDHFSRIYGILKVGHFLIPSTVWVKWDSFSNWKTFITYETPLSSIKRCPPPKTTQTKNSFYSYLGISFLFKGLLLNVKFFNKIKKSSFHFLTCFLTRFFTGFACKI